jgi:hypothetical protein
MMKFLKRFSTILTDYYRIEIKDRLPRIVSTRETLTRYLLSKKLFSRANNRVKPQAFMPPADLKLSVFRTDKLSEIQIWKIGEKRVARKTKPPRNLHGRADIKALKVVETGLRIIPDNVPPRHANIIDWPDEKSEIIEIALELAANASLALRF